MLNNNLRSQSHMNLPPSRSQQMPLLSLKNANQLMRNAESSGNVNSYQSLNNSDLRLARDTEDFYSKSL